MLMEDITAADSRRNTKTPRKRSRRVVLTAAIGTLVRFFLLPAFASCLCQAVEAQETVQSEPPTRAAMINPKAKELLDKCIQALGGDAFLRFKTLTTRGRTFAIEDEQTAGLAPFESFVLYPDKRRFSYGKKKPVILINDGDKQWELDKYGMTDQTPQQIRRWKVTNHYSLENLLRVRVREPGILVQDGGVDFVNNLPARVLDIVDAQHVQIKLFINRTTFLPVQVSYTVQNPQAGEPDDFADVYGDYQPVRGIQTPMHISRFLNSERVGEIFRNSAQYDQSYPPDYFRPTR